MKKLLYTSFLCIGLLNIFHLNAQTTDRASQLQTLEQNSSDNQYIIGTATLKSASRLFATRDDLTSVIEIIPADSVVEVFGSDSTYLHILYQNIEGYIFKRQAVMDEMPVNNMALQQPDAEGNRPVKTRQDRFLYLENKYGTNMATKLISGKIWKGMDAEMANDSWGTANKINRIINGNTVKEEWIFRNTWLYFENNILMDWGEIKRQ